MKPIELQLITIKMENGQQGIFVGTPIMNDPRISQENQVSEIWFSDVRGLPDNMPLAQLMELVRAQLCQCKETVH